VARVLRNAEPLLSEIYQQIEHQISIASMQNSRQEAFFPHSRTLRIAAPESNENEIIVQKAINEGKTTKDEIPQEFFCAISYQFMKDPVFDLNNPGIKYERTQIECWLARNQTNPYTRQRLSIGELKEDTNLAQ